MTMSFSTTSKETSKTNYLELFAMALHEGQLSGLNVNSLAESTVQNSISFVASTFWDHDRLNPMDEDGVLSRLLLHLFRAFKNKDPKPSSTKCITHWSDQRNHQVPNDWKQANISLQLVPFSSPAGSVSISSCLAWRKKNRYTSDEKHSFFFRDWELDHKDQNLEFAEGVTITFEWQKKDKQMDTVTQMASGDGVLCPVSSGLQ